MWPVTQPCVRSSAFLTLSCALLLSCLQAIIHNDLKPANVLIVTVGGAVRAKVAAQGPAGGAVCGKRKTPSADEASPSAGGEFSVAVLSDFGLARAVHAGMTTQGIAAGMTKLYAAPEVLNLLDGVRDSTSGRSADVYV